MSLLSALQILDETIVKMRHSVQSRILMEIALVQICNMQDLQALADLVKAFSAGHAAPPPRVVTNSPVAGSAVSSVTAPVASTTAVEAKKKDEFVETVASPIPEPDPRPTEKSSAPSPEQHSQESNSDKQKDAPIDSSESARTSDLVQSHERAAPIESSLNKPAVTNESLLEALRESAQGLGGLIVQCVAMITRLEPNGKGKWRACIAKDGGFAIDYFQTGENLRRLVTAAQSRTNVEMQLEFVLTNEIGTPLPAEEKAVAVEEFRPSVPQAQLIRGAMTHPLVKQFIDMFDGVVVRVDKPQVPRAHVATSESATVVPSDANEEVLTG
jgi:DNA polymerase-3 subunit gamma/tau